MGANCSSQTEATNGAPRGKLTKLGEEVVSGQKEFIEIINNIKKMNTHSEKEKALEELIPTKYFYHFLRLLEICIQQNLYMHRCCWLLWNLSFSFECGEEILLSINHELLFSILHKIQKPIANSACVSVCHTELDKNKKIAQCALNAFANLACIPTCHTELDKNKEILYDLCKAWEMQDVYEKIKRNRFGNETLLDWPN